MNRLYLTASLFLVLSALLTAYGQRVEFLERRIPGGSDEFIYRVFVPSGWSPSRQWPVILFLHGAGERGSDGVEQTQQGIGPAIQRAPARFPAIVVMPQCRRGVWWNDPQMEEMVLGALERSMEEFNGDPARVYLTGLSMGGYGAFYFASKYPEKFATIVSICGGVIPPRELRRASSEGFGAQYREVAEKIGRTPVWIFHGSDDRRVPVTESRQMRKALQEVGGDVKYTEYDGVGHNSWDRAYGEPELVPWMLSQQLVNGKNVQ